MTGKEGRTTDTRQREEAAQWFVRADARKLTAEEEREFQRWLSRPGNEAALGEVRKTWGLFDGAADDQHMRALHRAALSVKREDRLPRMAAGVAAIAALGAMIGYFMSRATVPPDTVPTAQAIANPGSDYSTSLGERLDVTLADGTRVTLNTDSRINVHYSADRRVVQLLKGQAYFQVERDVTRPFVVRTPDRRITALGTAFDVEMGAGTFQVMLVDGSVRVDGEHEDPAIPEEKPVVLSPGQALVARAGMAGRVVDMDVKRELRWREGFAEFEDEPLVTAVAEMNRYFANPIRIQDPRAAQLRVSGVFRTAQREEFLTILAELLPVQIKRAPDGAVEVASIR